MHITFLSASLTFMVIYVWARRNPLVTMNFLGVLNFPAPYMPFVLLAFSYLMSGQVPKSDALGIFVGHVYYYLEDVYPRVHRGSKLLKTPSFLKRLLGQQDRQNDSANILRLDDAPIERVNGADAGAGVELRRPNQNDERLSEGLRRPPSVADFFLDPLEEDLHED